MRTGFGYDAHRFSPDGPLVLAGVVVDESRGVAATSDGDVVAHAVADAILGACALGDIGEHFPSTEPRWRDADSMAILERVVQMAAAAGFAPAFADVTVIAERVRIAPHRAAMRAGLAAPLRLTVDEVSVKATTTDRLGWLGRDEGLAVAAVVTLRRP